MGVEIKMDEAANDDCDCCFCRGDLPADLIDELLNAGTTGEVWTREEYLAHITEKWG